MTIDQEYSIRAHKSYNPFKKGKQRFYYKQVSEKEVMAHKPSAKDIINVDEVNIQDLRDKGIVDGEMEVIGLLAKDNLEHNGRHLNYQKLDSIFTKNLGKDFKHKFLIIDENKNIIKKIGCGNDEAKGWLESKDIAIGLKPVRFMRVAVDVPLSSFIKSSIWTLIGTVLLAILIMACICIQLFVIKRKEYILRNREVCIHGSIHDLKTPLASVLFLLSYIEKKIIDQNQKNLLQKAETEINRLAEKIKYLLITAKGDESKIDINRTPICLMELANHAKDSIDIKYTGKPHQIILCDRRKTQRQIIADKMLIENVMRNLLENAVKYAEEGVCVNLDIDEDAKSTIISVKDNGFGIEKKYQKRIFEQFFRVPAEHPKDGYGLGLALVKYTIKAHGGKIKVESKIGKGSCFTFTLPHFHSYIKQQDDEK